MSKKEKKILELNDAVRDNLKKMYMVLAGLQVVQLILWFVETLVESVKVEELNIERSDSVSFFALWQEAPMLNVIFIIGFILTIAISALSIYKNSIEKRVFAIVAKTFAIISMIHNIFVIYIMNWGVDQSFQYYDIGDSAEIYAGPNFLGFVQVIVAIASVVIVSMISSKTKAINNWKKNK